MNETIQTSSTGYWLSRAAHFFDRGVASAVADLVAGGSVLDMGCGDGRYVEYWRSRGIEASGIDGNPTTWGRFLHIADLASPLSFAVHSWVVCLEVLEHIPRRFEAAVLDNLDAHAVEGLVVSWARPGQGGRGHYNERPAEYVRSVFDARGYQVDELASAEIRRRAKLDWFKSNALVFRNRGRRLPAVA